MTLTDVMAISRDKNTSANLTEKLRILIKQDWKVYEEFKNMNSNEKSVSLPLTVS